MAHANNAETVKECQGVSTYFSHLKYSIFSYYTVVTVQKILNEFLLTRSIHVSIVLVVVMLRLIS